MFLQAFIGGSLIGAGAILLMLFNGRIAGISGITATAITSANKDNRWRWAFLAGLILAPLLTAPAGFALPDAIPGHWVTLAIAGLLVGIGTRLGSGCTSGHGICGLSRLSLRSLVATLTFMATAMVTVFISKQLL